MNLDNAKLVLLKEATSLTDKVRRLKTRGLVITCFCGFIWIISALILSASAFTAALGWWGGSTTRILGWTLIISGIFATALLGLMQPIRKLRRKDAVLLRIGEVYPHMASDVRTAGQLAAIGVSGLIETTRFSPILVAEQLTMVHRFLDDIMPQGLVFPLRRLLPPFIAMLLSLGVFISAKITAPEIIDLGMRSIFYDNRPPMKGRRVLEKTPVVADLSVTLKYPEYLKQKKRKLDNVSGGFSAPLGTSVFLNGRSLVKNTTQGEIRLPDGSNIPLSIKSNGDVAGNFVIGSAGKFIISLGNDQLMTDGPPGDIELEADSPPSIHLLRPSGQIEIGEDGEVELEFEAADDHGISRIDIVVRSGSSPEIRKTAVRLTDDIKQFKTKFRWRPSGIRLDSNDMDLEIEMEAYDDDTILGPKSGRTETLAVKLLTPQSRHNNALEEQNKTLDNLVDLLAYRLENPIPAGKTSASDAAARYASVRGQTEDLLATAAKLIGRLSRDALTPKRVIDTFVQIRRDLSNQLLFEGRLYEGQTIQDHRNRQGVDRVTSRLLERAISQVDDIIIEQQMSKIVKDGSILESSRIELMEILTRYVQTRSESLRRNLIDSIDKIESELINLEKQIERIRGKVGDTFVNSSRLRIDLLDTFSKLKKLLADEDISGATSLAKRIQNDLGRLLAALERSLLSFRTERFGEGDGFPNDLLERVMAIEEDQLQLRRDTVALKRSSLERLSNLMKGKIEPLVKKELTRWEKMRKLKQDMKLKDDPSFEELLERTLEELGLALSQGDLEEARQVAEELKGIGGDAMNIVSPKNKPLLRALQSEAKQTIAEITDAIPKPAQLLSEKDARRANIRSVEQRLILSKTRNLRAWIKKQSDKSKFLSSRVSDSLSESIKRMSDSVSQLELRQISQSIEEQSLALNQLSELREELKRGGESVPIESRALILNGRVELPTPDQFIVPAEFRADILEAMRGDYPSLYEEAIKKYYEALVR